MTDKLYFASDYQEGAHPAIIKRLSETNLMHFPGYGLEPICDAAKAKIRAACDCPDAEVELLVGGTQTNATVIDALLHSYDGVISADSGHVNVHEAGAIESGGHKVLALSSNLGKLTAEQIEQYLSDFEADANCEHMVHPGMVYLSQPTEFGTLYTKAELTAISDVCHTHHIPLYIDGARLAYGLAAPENDVTLIDLADLCDAFYIGGTKCGALFGEAVVMPNPKRIPHFFTIIKQHGALLAKGWLLGVQFDELFTDDRYLTIGEPAIKQAHKIKTALRENGFELYFDSPTNQVFFIIDDAQMTALSEKVVFAFDHKIDDTHTVVRLCTSWATKTKDTDALCDIIASL